MTTRRSAFTLIELLVVIAIIAILAAILFPVFAQAKMAAKKTAALSQIKQLGTAVQIYLADYDDTYSKAQYWDQGTAFIDGFRMWSSELVIGPYTKNTQLLVSPGDNLKALDKAAFASMTNATVRNKLTPTSLMANAITPWSWGATIYGVANPLGLMPYGTEYWGGYQGAVSATAVPNPSEMVLLANGKDGLIDKVWGCGAWNQQELDWCYGPASDVDQQYVLDLLILATPTDPYYNAWRQYSGSTPFVFADSSAKSLRPGQLREAKRWIINAP